MSDGVLSMSEAERDRAFLVRQAVEGRIGQCETSARLGIGTRQFKRLVQAWKAAGDAGLVSRHRGRQSNNRLSEDQRSRIAALLGDDMYRGFGATPMAETLIVFIDDATNRLTALRFAPSETTRAYLETARAHVLAHGVPLAFYAA